MNWQENSVLNSSFFFFLILRLFTAVSFITYVEKKKKRYVKVISEFLLS